MGRRIADDVGEALDRVDAILSVVATDVEQEEAIIRALDAVIAPADPVRELLSDAAIRVIVRRVARIVRRRVRGAASDR